MPAFQGYVGRPFFWVILSKYHCKFLSSLVIFCLFVCFDLLGYFICFAVLETDSNDSLSNVSLQMSSSSMSSMSLLSDQLQKHLLSSTLVTNSGQVKKSNFNLNQTHSEYLGDKISIRWSYKSHKYLDNSSSHPGTHSIPFTIHQHQPSVTIKN